MAACVPVASTSPPELPRRYCGHHDPTPIGGQKVATERSVQVVAIAGAVDVVDGDLADLAEMSQNCDGDIGQGDPEQPSPARPASIPLGGQDPGHGQRAGHEIPGRKN